MRYDNEVFSELLLLLCIPALPFIVWAGIYFGYFTC